MTGAQPAHGASESGTPRRRSPCTGVCRRFDTRTSAVGFSSELPTRLNRTLDLLANNRVRFKVDAFDEVHLIEGLQNIVIRITLGLIMAALIVSAAFLMRVETP